MPYSNTTEFDRTILQRTYDLIKVICFDFEREMQVNMYLNHEVTLFCGVQPPAISIENYLQRAARYLQFDQPNFIYMYIYMDRFFKNSPTDFINYFNVHRVAINCLQLAHKMLDDDPVDDRSIFFKAAGINSTELNTLEQATLARLDCRLYVSERDYITTKKKLVDLARLLDLSNHRILGVHLNAAEQEFINNQSLAPAPQTSPAAEEAPDTDMDESVDAPSTAELFKELKQLAPGYEEPIRYDSPSQQWFYKKSDLRVEQIEFSEPNEHLLTK